MPILINSSGAFYVPTEADVVGADATNDGSTSGNASSTIVLPIGFYNATLPTLTNGQAGAFQTDNRSRLIIAPIEAGTNSIGAVTNLGIGAPADAAATSDTGTFSLLSLFKRLLSRIGATRLYVATTIATSGDNTVITAPASGVRIVISGLRIQNNTTTTTTILIKDGASGSTLARLRATTDGSGVSENYSLGDEIRLTTATALVINLSGANTHGVSIRYWLETASTGLPA